MMGQVTLVKRSCILAFSFLAGVLTVIGCQAEATRPAYLDARVSFDGGMMTQSSKYPEGPYGQDNPEVGDIVENLQFDGFISPVDGTLANHRKVEGISFGDLRKTGKRFAVVHVSAFWCESCTLGALDLSENAKTVMQRDGVILELLVDGSASGADPTFKELDEWVEKGGLEVTTVLPGDDRVREVFPSREYAYIIELATMKVVWRHSGLFEQPSTVERAVDALLSQYLD
jgi:hypothetical protein